MNTSALAENATQVLIETLKKLDIEIESAIETLEVMSDTETLRNIEEGLQEIGEGKSITFKEFLKKHVY